ncbi:MULTISPECIES: NB-ARC domain-containing protein [Cyanophyceae]|uniref:NB-ARC domain-containing protein n=1 Tax=Cyanophyceae TaxID=3028117 RepID=UPI0016889725|nr:MULTISPECIES: NB-ARC domain-containing protein [Cyanophyceae]MBD1914626.1 NB-ARC domain-containing protein [Phormidium sp. FACHB-77]MBD2030995.1 NB-ARC domain-containing protein [Phormidium sp. FACHB-322]MBD2052602.1 NB-ARC domain-containing protein [Leptolyngbya sp. FACHB-60]
MASDAVELADRLVFTVTGRHLNDLQRTILHQVWQGQKYLDIANTAGYTEGHIKDVAYQMWRLLSKVTGEKVTKSTLKSALQRSLRKMGIDVSGASAALGRTDLLAQPEAFQLASSVSLFKGNPVQTTQGEDLGSQIALTNSAETSASTAANPNFVGRQEAIAHLTALIAQGDRTILIQGEGGLGKTTLAQHFVAEQPVDLTLELLMAKDPADITPVEWVVEEWLRQDFGVEPGREFGVTLDRLRRHLRQQRVAVLIDNLEPALDAQGQFIAPHRRYSELLRVLADSRGQTLTLMTSRDRLCEPGIPITHYRLPGLELPDWATYFAHRGIPDHGDVLAAMHSAYGGNAKAMEILAGSVQADFEGSLALYWQAHSQDLLGPVDLKNLVESQINRLRDLDSDAHRLFCRLGVYRYQDVPTIPWESVQCLMIDIPVQRHQAIATSLRNRSLLECRQGRYWLHPVVRAGALAQLSANLKDFTEWESAHRSAARCWSDSIQRVCTLEDAIQALEAYYHYVAIQDYGAAARVILHSRDNQWQQFLPLGSTLYRMGLVQPVTDAITAIIDHIPAENADASELSNILGDLYWIQGRLEKAIACQQNAIAIAQTCLHTEAPDANTHRWYYLTMLVVDSQLSLGLYYLDLWNLDAAATWFSQVIATATGTRHQPWADKATTCLALVRSYQGDREAAQPLADSIIEQVRGRGQSGRHAFFVQLLGHAYLNLGDLDRAELLFTAAIQAAEAGHYLQIKANALIGLGRLKPQRGNVAGAMEDCEGAIALLDEVGAHCDLAAAHLQYALTLACLPMYFSEAQTHFCNALSLFESIPAPHQVARAKQLWLKRLGHTESLAPN